MFNQNTINHYRAIRVGLSVHRWNPLETFKTWRQWQNGECQLYDERGFIY